MVVVLRELFAKRRHPSYDDQESAAQTLASILEQAQVIGREHVTGIQERGMAWGGKFRNILQSAWNIVTNFVQRIGDWFAEQDTEALTEEDIINEVGTLAETVAEAEIQSAIEQEVLDTLQEQGFLEIISIAQEGACEKCRANAEQGPIPIGGVFQSGDAKPPYHNRCKCSLGAP